MPIEAQKLLARFHKIRTEHAELKKKIRFFFFLSEHSPRIDGSMVVLWMVSALRTISFSSFLGILNPHLKPPLQRKCDRA